MAVRDTGSISGKMIFRKLCHADAPSTRAASIDLPGSAWRPASSMSIMNGMKIQASRTIIVSLASSALAKKAGSSQPSARASCGTGPKRNSSMDLPIIHDTATGDSISGSRNTTRKKRRARIWALSSSARPKAMASSTRIARRVPDHVAERVPVERVAQHPLDVAQAREPRARRATRGSSPRTRWRCRGRAG